MGNTLILSFLFRSGEEHCDLALAVELRRGGGGGGEEGGMTSRADVKSNNPRLTGGEQQSCRCRNSLAARFMCLQFTDRSAEQKKDKVEARGLPVEISYRLLQVVNHHHCRCGVDLQAWLLLLLRWHPEIQERL